jgi:hypothetical protein
VAWHNDKRGFFSVKSAYKVAMEHNIRTSRTGDQSSSNGEGLNKKQWKQIWALKCRGKIRHFIWRMAHSTIAKRMMLKRRGVELETKCVMCDRLDEDGAHLFFKCKFVKQ